MDREEIARRYDLATSQLWKAIKELFLEKIIEYSKGGRTPEQIQGMLLLLSVPDAWVERFHAEKKKAERDE